jgi:hypothetical protein
VSPLRAILWLLAAAAVAAGLVLAVLRDAPRDVVAPAAVRPIAPEEAARIRVERAGETVVLARAGDSWRIVEPASLDADRAVLRGLLARLWHPAPRRVLDAPGDLAPYGLSRGTVVARAWSSAPTSPSRGGPSRAACRTAACS